MENFLIFSGKKISEQSSNGYNLFFLKNSLRMVEKNCIFEIPLEISDEICAEKELSKLELNEEIIYIILVNIQTGVVYLHKYDDGGYIKILLFKLSTFYASIYRKGHLPIKEIICCKELV